jgi:hypothetical protein
VLELAGPGGGEAHVDSEDRALAQGTQSDAERWLLFYSLKASRVEVRDGEGNAVDLDERPQVAQGEAEADQQH